MHRLFFIYFNLYLSLIQSVITFKQTATDWVSESVFIYSESISNSEQGTGSVLHFWHRKAWDACGPESCKTTLLSAGTRSSLHNCLWRVSYFTVDWTLLFIWFFGPSEGPRSSPAPTHSPSWLLLSVDVYDVLHQQIPLQAVDSVAVQHHLMATGWTAETTSSGSDARGASGLPQRVGLSRRGGRMFPFMCQKIKNSLTQHASYSACCNFYDKIKGKIIESKIRIEMYNVIFTNKYEQQTEETVKFNHKLWQLWFVATLACDTLLSLLLFTPNCRNKRQYKKVFLPRSAAALLPQ